MMFFGSLLCIYCGISFYNVWNISVLCWKCNVDYRYGVFSVCFQDLILVYFYGASGELLFAFCKRCGCVINVNYLIVFCVLLSVVSLENSCYLCRGVCLNDCILL